MGGVKKRDVHHNDRAVEDNKISGNNLCLFFFFFPESRDYV